jgi:hypothetical protein
MANRLCLHLAERLGLGLGRNGLVANVNQFSGDLSGNFGTVHFSSTLNDAGTHTSGTYSISPGAVGNCLAESGLPTCRVEKSVPKHRFHYSSGALSD